MKNEAELQYLWNELQTLVEQIRIITQRLRLLYAEEILQAEPPDKYPPRM